MSAFMAKRKYQKHTSNKQQAKTEPNVNKYVQEQSIKTILTKFDSVLFCERTRFFQMDIRSAYELSDFHIQSAIVSVRT